MPFKQNFDTMITTGKLLYEKVKSLFTNQKKKKMKMISYNLTIF